APACLLSSPLLSSSIIYSSSSQPGSLSVSSCASSIHPLLPRFSLQTQLEKEREGRGFELN
uniref:Uncharacterized protein n=1 Tax=Aegilops tauschii subsp. strangulata TaxID=200361 RepID=A0A453PZG3_AEGTS